MESLGFRFFESFSAAVAAAWIPLVIVFVAFIGRQIWRFRPDERLLSLLMFLYFFLVITSFWVLKPLKKGLWLGYYDKSGLDLAGWLLNAAQAEMLAKVLNMGVAFVAMVAFTMLASRFRRQQLSYIASAFFGVCYVIYWFLLDAPGAGTVWTFYLFGDLFSTVMVVTFFAFLNDSVSSEQAKRLYGLIVLGGLSGGAFGANIVAARVKGGGTGEWMWVCIGMVLVIALLAAAAGRIVSGRESEATAPSRDAAAPPPAVGGKGSPALEGARLALRSPYLLSVVAIVGLYEMVSTIMDFQFSSAVGEYLDGALIRQQISRVFAFMNVIAFTIQVFVTRFVMTRYGMGVALLFLPVASLCGSVGFLVAPALLIGSLLPTADNAFSYSINQSAKEALYVPTTRDEKYKAKAFIDMFVQRFAKAIAVGLSLAITTLFAGFGSVRWLSLVTAVILVLWILAARYAGRVFAEKEAAAAS